MSAVLSLRALSLFLGLALSLVLALPNSARAELFSKTIAIEGVTELEVRQGFRVEIRQSEHEYVRATAHPEALAHIVAEQRQNRLVLGSATESPLPVLFEIQLRDVSAIRLIGVNEASIEPLDIETLSLSARSSGHIELAGIDARQLDLTFSGSGVISSHSLVADMAELKLSGSGSISVDQLTVGDLQLDLSGSAGVHFVSSGMIDSSSIHLAGTGIYRAANTITRQAEIDIAGSASALVNVTESLDVSTSGSGTVTYYGNPDLDTGIFGTGLVEQAL